MDTSTKQTDESENAALSARMCLVTCGATAPFPLLVEAVLKPAFLTKLSSLNYTQLIIQCGDFPSSRLNELISSLQDTKPANLHIEGFPYGRGQFWQKLLRAAKGTQLDCRSGEEKVVQQLDDGVVRAEGVIISHAGTGTILDAMRIDCPLIVVPNPELMDNHQEELAETMAGFEYLVHGSIDNMPKALDDAAKLAERKKQMPPVNSGEHRKSGAGAEDYADQEIPWIE